MGYMSIKRKIFGSRGVRGYARDQQFERKVFGAGGFKGRYGIGKGRGGVKLARIGARKGFDKVSTNGSSFLGSSRGIEAVFEFTDFGGAVTVFSAGNNKILHGIGTLAVYILVILFQQTTGR